MNHHLDELIGRNRRRRDLPGAGNQNEVAARLAFVGHAIVIVVLGSVPLEDIHCVGKAAGIAVIDPSAAARGRHAGVHEQRSATANDSRAAVGEKPLHSQRALAASARSALTVGPDADIHHGGRAGRKNG